MNSAFRYLACMLPVVMATPVVHAQTLLAPGETVQFSLDGGSFTNDIAVDVPDAATFMRIELDAPGGADIDLLLRYGEAFPVNGNAGVFGGVNWLFEHAHYRSISSGADEWIVVTKRQRQPLRAGRWHLSVINFGNQTAQISVRADIHNALPGDGVPITVAFDDNAKCSARQAQTAPWFDTASTTPVGGNTGSTLGEQRRNAFNHALERIRDELDGFAPIHIVACWKNLGGDASSATLASAGPNALIRDDGAFTDRFIPMPFLPKTYTWYSSAGTSQLAGNDLCRFGGGACGSADIFIQFNTEIDGDTVLGTRKFHYGFDAPGVGSQSIDFVATAMHEITHGLGFTGLIDLDAENGIVGDKFRACYSDGYCEPVGHDDAYSDAVVHIDGSAARPINALSIDERAMALTSGLALRWADAEAVASPLNPLRQEPFPQNLPPLYAPAGLSPGSTLSHLDTSFFSQLMMPFISNGLRTLGLAQPMLAAVGWPRTVAPLPEPATPYGGQWFDPTRSGHGIDLHRVEGLPDTYMLVLYTFDADGLPEWYLSIGRIVDGMFRPGDDGNGNSLWRTRYLFGPPPGQAPDTSVPGRVRIDFNQAGRSPVCNDATGRNAPLALMTFSLGEDEHMKWCLTQIVPAAERPDFDRSGHWFAGDDDAGWGLTALSYGENGLFAVLYYPDAAGRPRWAAIQENDFRSGEPLTLHQVQGYCRTCPAPASNPAVAVGEMRLRLDPPEGSQGEVAFDVEFAGPGGGHFSREGVPMIRIAESAPVGE